MRKIMIRYLALTIVILGFTSCCVTGYCQTETNNSQQSPYKNDIKDYNTNL